MSVPFEAFKKMGPQQEPLSISFSETSPGGSKDSSDGFPYDLDKTGNIGKDRFRQRIERSLQRKLPDIIKNVPIDGTGDQDIIHVHLPPEKRPIFQRGVNGHKGYGQGDGEPGDVVAPGPNSGNGREAGHNQEGDGGYDVEVTADDILKMVFQNWELPDLEEKASGQMTDDKVEWNDRRKSGVLANLDKRATIKQNLMRRALEQHKLPPEERTQVRFGEVKNEDLRFRTWNVSEKPITNAVVFAMRDVSASMGEEEAYATNVMLSWAVRFLQTQYTQVRVVFGYHHSKAKINLSQQEFFHPTESGGTDLIPALQLMNETIDSEYPPEEWNVYPFYVGDGEIYERSNNPTLIQELTALLNRSRRLFYAETSLHGQQMPLMPFAKRSNLMDTINQLNDPRIIHAQVNNHDDIGKALDTFFKKQEGKEGAVHRS